MRVLIVVCSLFFMSCKLPEKPSDVSVAAPVLVNDPHSFADPSKAIVKHLDLDITVDFEKQQIAGFAHWTIDNISKGNEIIFDAGTLTIESVTIDDEKEVDFHLDSATSFLGRALHIAILPETKNIHIKYHSTANARALQWLTPMQTAGKKSPFLFTQSESIWARSWIPCQDGPAVRFTYNATVTVPKKLLALMSAENPQQKNELGIYHFQQTHPIPSYLVALAVGDIAFKAIDGRTGVYAEPAMLEKVAWEFADMGKMVNAAEKLYGPYRWGRYDILVLPPSFPYGGMENPNLTFATPTVIAGDRSLVSLVAHELAHSWSGNLVTNATWNDMWLNEGFTTYFERRILEVLYGKNEKEMQEVLGKNDWLNDLATLPAGSPDGSLKGHVEGRDADDAGTNIIYEKGYSFLRLLEETVGREQFDAFLKSYFNAHAFQSMTTEAFIPILEDKLLRQDTALINKIGVHQWIYDQGIPANTPMFTAASFLTLDSVFSNWEQSGFTKNALQQNRKFSTNESLYFITHLPEALGSKHLSTIDSVFHFTQSGNAEIQAAWYKKAVEYQYKAADNAIETFLMSVGRRKFIAPIYKSLASTPQGKQRAIQIFEKAKQGYHPYVVNYIKNILYK